MKHSKNSRRNVEGFVAWKEKSSYEEQKDTDKEKTSMTSRGVIRKGTQKSGSYESQHGYRESHKENVIEKITSADSSRVLQGGSSRPLKMHVQQSPCHGDDICKRARVHYIPRSSSASKVLCTSKVHSKESKSFEKLVGRPLATSTLHISGETSNTKHLQHLAILKGDDSMEGSGKDDEEFSEDELQPPSQGSGEENKILAFSNDDGSFDGMAEGENEGHTVIHEDGAIVADLEKTLNMEGVTIKEESAKRKERRQAQSMWLREGNRRTQEGKPRNYLLVDEYTGKPYGIGVGDWKKELMLLSRELDPAIGNINKQPEGVLLEIAEWIQHTWEYSAPVKFKYVKETIARGVTLRRRDLWRMIRNNEPKPHKVSDRSWRTLQRLLDSTAFIKKSENCSKANACRVNFGRTGPSGEAGVRERLRSKLRRSPDPHEIGMEMARDKGYGGRSKRKFSTINIMHGNEYGTKRHKYEADVNVQSLASETADESEDVEHENGGDSINAEGLHQRGEKEEGVGGGVLSFSAEEIAKHPLVMKMIERLEALEGQRSATEGGKNGIVSTGVTNAVVQENMSTAMDSDIGAEKQGFEDKIEVKVSCKCRASRRLRKTA